MFAALRQGAQSGVFEPAEQQIVERVFQFADRRVSAIMTPRSHIVWLDINDNHLVWRHEISGSPYSRFPVCDGDLDHVLGVLRAKEFLAAPENFEIRSLLQPPITVPEQTPALKVLENFR